MIVLALLLFLFSTATAAEFCDVPKPHADFDPSKMKGDWYLAFHSADHIMGEDVECVQLQNIKATDLGWDVDALFYHSGDTSEPKPSLLQKYRLPDGNFVAIQDTDQHEIHNPDGTVNQAALEEYTLLHIEETLHVTDYESFFYLISCSPNGNWVVWCFTSNPNPTVATILKATNVLVDYGVATKLYPSGCADLMTK